MIYLDSETVVLVKLIAAQHSPGLYYKKCSATVSRASVTKIRLLSFNVTACVPYFPVCKLGYLFSKGLRIKKTYSNVLFICTA